MPKLTSLRGSLLVFGGVVVAWLLAWGLIAANISEPDARGQFGDMFGAVNALFSGLAFAALIVALLLQREELSLQRQELRDTREVLADQGTELRKQAATLDVQSFETTFFRLLEFQVTLVSSWDLRTASAPDLQGRKCIEVLYERMIKRIKLARASATDPKAAVVDGYTAFYRDFESLLGPYFRGWYHVFKLADDAETRLKATNRSAAMYTNLARAQLSAHELAILFYNCMSPLGQGFRPLIVQYAVFKHLPFEYLHNAQEQVPHFHRNAYGKDRDLTAFSFP